MNTPHDNTAPKGLRGWWLTPPRPGLQRLIHPWEYRHLRAFALVRIVGGCAAAVVGLICLLYGGYGWAAFFLVVAALDLAWAYWELTIARSASART
jgi:hypothetical protein